MTPMIAWRWDPAKQLQLKPKEIVYVGDTVWQAQALWAQGLGGQLSNLVVRPRKKFAYLKRKIQDKNCLLLRNICAINSIYLMSHNFKRIYFYLYLNLQKYSPVLPRIMNFGRIRIPNNIRIFKNDKYEYYSEFEKLFEYYSWEIFK